jgi:glutamate racemase
MKIGVFDSGLGGLSILREILKTLPFYDYVYLGDNARVPYGGRSLETVYRFTEKAVDFLFKKKNCGLVIIACNTATAAALRKIQRKYLVKSFPKRRVLGVIRPTVEAVFQSKMKKVGVIGTYATVSSKAFSKEIKKLNKKVKVYQKACPLLVPIIEEGELDWKGLDLILDKYLAVFSDKNIDSLILGCTHYGLILEKVKKAIGKDVKVVFQGNVVAGKLKDYLKRHPEIEKSLDRSGKRDYFVTDFSRRYEKMARMFLGEHFTKKNKLKLVDIWA